MERKRITIVGIGLIGGSLAIQLHEKKLSSRLIGVDANAEHASKAVELELVDEVMNLDDAVAASDVIMLAIPVDKLVDLLPSLMDKIDKQIVIDLGSTKSQSIEAIRNHPKRGRYVATHPVWGTEKSGPGAVVKDAFKDRVAVICDKEKSDADALELVERLYTAIGMRLVYMDAAAHDVHAAYVSHISHVASYALSLTVLEKEKEEDAIFELASGGFESTVRLAKSNPDMWVPIFMQNKDNVLDVLNEHISQLRKFKSCLEKENYEYLTELIVNANKIKRILK